MRRTALALVLLAPALLAGCATPETGQGERGPITITVETDRETIAPGQWMNVSLTFEHTGSEPYTYQHPGCPPAAFTSTVDADQGEIRLYMYGQEPMFGTCAVRNVTVEPGQVHTETFQWNGHVEDQPPDPHGGDRVAPGSYELTTELARADGGPTFAATTTVTVES